MKFKTYPISDAIKVTLDEMNIIKPTDIQHKAIQPILDGEDVFAIAPTGTGKTAAFVIPIVEKIIQRKRNKSADTIQCLTLAPTRELALQISKVYEQIGKGTGFKVGCVYGGVEQEDQIRRLVKGIDVLVCTPGRMFDLIHQGFVDLHKIQFLVIDEADLMLDTGFKKIFWIR